MAQKFNVQKLETDARRYGLNLREIGDILAKWGPAVLKLIISALREGLNMLFIKEILDTLGPLFLQQAVSDIRLKNRRRAAKRVSPSVLPVPLKFAEFPEIVQGEEVDSFDDKQFPGGNLILDLIMKYLPQLLEKYAPQLIQWIIDTVLNALKDPNKRAQFAAVLEEELNG